jgi:hypothetical protein
VDLRTTIGGDALVGVEWTSSQAARLAEQTGRPALAAVNGDFFVFDPPGVPTGLQVAGGEMVAPPSARPAFAVTVEGALHIGLTRLDAGVRFPDGTRQEITAVNRAGDGLVLLNRYAAGPGEPDLPPGTVAVRPLRAPTAAGDTIRGVVTGNDDRDRATVRLVPLEGTRLPVAAGDTIRWWTGLHGPPGPVREAVGGVPVLVRDGRSVVHQAELAAAFSERPHPRTAVGWTGDGALLLVVVDGRQPGHSDGMSLDELADLMIGLGAVEALNLDGGGSSTLVVRGAVTNRPSDGEERPVANALVVLGPATDDPLCPQPTTR